MPESATHTYKRWSEALRLREGNYQVRIVMHRRCGPVPCFRSFSGDILSPSEAPAVLSVLDRTAQPNPRNHGTGPQLHLMRRGGWDWIVTREEVDFFLPQRYVFCHDQLVSLFETPGVPVGGGCRGAQCVRTLVSSK